MNHTTRYTNATDLFADLLDAQRDGRTRKIRAEFERNVSCFSFPKLGKSR
jgi:hypothetical protein